ncbi:Inositol-tetrakisphosphate 1-kinase [Taenia solium]|eukprot:TsM_000223600 transcript=TsM_000223600 gene=TsM_000223600
MWAFDKGMKLVGIFVEDKKFDKLGFQRLLELESDLRIDIRSVRDANVKFPAVCKPLTSHGKAEAHKMIIFFKEDDLSLINCHSVVQSFENHDGVLLKAYIIGDFFYLVTRPSIRNLPKDRRTSPRTRLRLEFMGVDFVVPSNAERKQHLAVVDVNVFPDYSCVPNFHFHLENLVRGMLDLSKPPLPVAVLEAGV